MTLKGTVQVNSEAIGAIAVLQIRYTFLTPRKFLFYFLFYLQVSRDNS